MQRKPCPSRTALVGSRCCSHPCSLIFVLSFFQRGDYGGITWTFTLDNYLRAMEPLYVRIMVRSLRSRASRP